jgi:uncharacterized membrane protein YccC
MDATATGQARRLLQSWAPRWSIAAAMRAVRATVVVPVVLAVTFEVLHNEQMALFAVFGSFGALVLTSFGGSRRDKATAHLGLAVGGSVALIVGTLASGSAWLAAVVSVPMAFGIYFAGVLGPNAAAGVTATLLAYVLPVASTGAASTIPDRLAGWWLGNAASTLAVLILSPKPAGDQLRRKAAALASALAQHLRAAVAGTATTADLEATKRAKHELMTFFNSTPYRPVGLAAIDQALASLVAMLDWCATMTSETLDGHLDLSAAASEDRELLAESGTALGAIAAMLERGDLPPPNLEQIWRARVASAAHLRNLQGQPAVVRSIADHAFYAQAIGVAASAAAADTLIAQGRLDPDSARAMRVRWLVAQPNAPSKGDAAPGDADLPPVGRAPRRAGRTLITSASVRSVWFRNSARGAAAIAVAVAVAKVTNVQHAFWVILGTLSVLRGSAGATGSTAVRALGGTVIGFAVGAALLVGIGTSPVALWVALPIAVLVAAYTPGTAPFAVGQAAFTVTVVVLFNLLVPAGWQTGLVRVEDVALGCAVSIVAGVLFWPRGASALFGDDLADALRAAAGHLKESAGWALGVTQHSQAQLEAAVQTGVRLDDAVRAYLTEQGSKRLAKHDLWVLANSALRVRLTAYSLGSLPGLRPVHAEGGKHPLSPDASDAIMGEAGQVTRFYDEVATDVGKQAEATPPLITGPVLEDPDFEFAACADGPLHYHVEALWVEDHLNELASHASQLAAPASRLAEVRRRPWWR